MSDMDRREPIHDAASDSGDELVSPQTDQQRARRASDADETSAEAAAATTAETNASDDNDTTAKTKKNDDLGADPADEPPAMLALSIADGVLGNMSFVPAVGATNRSISDAPNADSGHLGGAAPATTNVAAATARAATDVGIGPVPGRDATSVAINQPTDLRPGTHRYASKTDIPPHLRATDYCTVPWAQRTPYDDDNNSVGFIGFFNMTPHVILRIEFAMRCAVSGILPAAVLAYNPNTTVEWPIPSLIVTLVVVTASHRLGTGINMLWQALNALVLSIAVAEILIAIDVKRHWAVFYGLYALVTFLIAAFTGGFVSKLGGFFVTIFFVLIDKEALAFKNSDESEYLFPLHFAKPVLTGCAFGLAVALFPFPRTHRGKLETNMKAIFSTINICFIGLSDSMWTESPLERRINYARIESLRGSLRRYFDDAYADLDAMSFEPWSGATHARARQRLKLAESLLSSLDGMMSVISHLCRSSASVDESERARLWGDRFQPAMLIMNDYMDEFTKRIHKLSVPVTPELIEKLKVANDVVDGAYRQARGAAFSDNGWMKQAHPENEFPFVIMGYFLFNYGGFLASCMRYDTDSDTGTHESNLLKRVLLYPLRRLMTIGTDMRDIVRLDRGMLLRLREAVKLSFAMTTAIALLLFLDVQDPAGGAAVIGFVKEADPAITVLASLDFVMGTAVGSVLGFLAATMANNLTELIAYMCVLAFLTGFIRSGSRYGPLGFLLMFFSLAAMAPGAAEDAALLVTIQQNVAAMLWLGLTHLVLYPTWPSEALHENTQSSLLDLRAMLLSFTAAVEADAEDFEHVDAVKSKLVGMFGAQMSGITFAAQEPSVKKLPYPDTEARALLHAQEDIHKVIGPAILAARVEAAWSRQDSRKRGQLLLPDKVMRAMRQYLPQVTVDLEQVLRAIEATEAACNGQQELTAVLLETHQKLQQSLFALNDACTREFVAAIGSEEAGWASPFRMPAVHTMMHFFAVLGPYMHRLLTAAVHLRRIRQLRG